MLWFLKSIHFFSHDAPAFEEIYNIYLQLDNNKKLTYSDNMDIRESVDCCPLKKKMKKRYWRSYVDSTMLLTHNDEERIL